MEKLHHKVKTTCPNEAVLTAYLGGTLKEEEARALEEHIASCRLCLENVRAGHMGDKLDVNNTLPGPNDKLIHKAKGIAKMKGSKVLQRNLWLAGTILAFSLSFIVGKYFAQFLVASLILGLKWVSESEGIRTLIVSMDAKRRHEQAEKEESRWIR